MSVFAQTISGTIKWLLLRIIDTACLDAKDKKIFTPKTNIPNAYSNWAIPVFQLSVALVESFINESMLSLLPPILLTESFLYGLEDRISWMKPDKEENVRSLLSEDRYNNKDRILEIVVCNLRKIRFEDKMKNASNTLLGIEVNSGTYPYNDMIVVNRLRSAFTHYLPTFERERYVKTLSARGLAYEYEENMQSTKEITISASTWVTSVSNISMIIWAQNTASYTIKSLITTFPEEHREGFLNRDLHSTLPINYFEELLKNGISNTNDSNN